MPMSRKARWERTSILSGPAQFSLLLDLSVGDEHAYPDLSDLNGRNVEIAGVVALNGRPLIIMTDPNQLAVIG